MLFSSFTQSCKQVKFFQYYFICLITFSRLIQNNQKFLHTFVTVTKFIKMFKENRQQLSFVYTECSDVTTEVFVSNDQSCNEKLRFKDNIYRNFASSFNSIEHLRTQTSQTYPPPVNNQKKQRRPIRSVRFKREDKLYDEQFVKTSKQKKSAPKNDIFITKLVPCSVPLAVNEYAEYTEEIDMSSKEFESLHGCCFEIEETKNDNSYLYILKSPYKNHSSTMMGNMHQGSSKEISNTSSQQIECHTVGDLLSFASNTMRFTVSTVFLMCLL